MRQYRWIIPILFTVAIVSIIFWFVEYDNNPNIATLNDTVISSDTTIICTVDTAKPLENGSTVNQSDSLESDVNDQSSEVLDKDNSMPRPHVHFTDPYYRDLPFFPSDCPRVFVQGNDREAMLSNKTLSVNVYGRNYILKIGSDSPNGVNAKIYTENFGVDLLSIINFRDGEYECFFDEFEDLNSDCNIQITLMDFNNDDECEVLFTIQSNELAIMNTYVFKLLPHPYKNDIVRYLGYAQGQSIMYIDGTTIIAPIGFHGLCNEYILAPNDKIIEINSTN